MTSKEKTEFTGGRALKSYADRARALANSVVNPSTEQLVLTLVDRIFKEAEKGFNHYDVDPSIPIDVQRILVSPEYGFKIKDHSHDDYRGGVTGSLRISW